MVKIYLAYLQFTIMTTLYDIKKRCDLFNLYFAEQRSCIKRVNFHLSSQFTPSHMQNDCISKLTTLGKSSKNWIPIKPMNITWSTYVCWNYVGIPYSNNWKWFFKTIQNRVYFLMKNDKSYLIIDLLSFFVTEHLKV